MPNFPTGLTNSRDKSWLQQAGFKSPGFCVNRWFTKGRRQFDGSFFCFIWGWISWEVLQWSWVHVRGRGACVCECVSGGTVRKGVRYKNVRRAENKWRGAQWILRGRPEVKVGPHWLFFNLRCWFVSFVPAIYSKRHTYLFILKFLCSTEQNFLFLILVPLWRNRLLKFVLYF